MCHCLNAIDSDHWCRKHGEYIEISGLLDKLLKEIKAEYAAWESSPHVEDQAAGTSAVKSIAHKVAQLTNDSRFKIESEY